MAVQPQAIQAINYHITTSNLDGLLGATARQVEVGGQDKASGAMDPGPQSLLVGS